MQACVLLAPLAVLLLVFMGWPILWTVILSFTNMQLTGPTATNWDWIGFGNYLHLFQSGGFLNSLWLSFVYLIGSAYLGQTVFGFILAYLFMRRSRWIRAMVGGIIVVSWVIPEIVGSYMWYALLSEGGVLADALRVLHIPYSTWLISHPMLSVNLANAWRGCAFSVMLFSAALSNVPPELLEAASVDGASSWWKITRVMVPLITHSILVDLVLVTLGTLNDFTLIYAMTGGGPGSDSMVLSVYMYQAAFNNYQLSYGSAISVVMLIIGVALSVVYARLLREDRALQ